MLQAPTLKKPPATGNDYIGMYIPYKEVIERMELWRQSIVAQSVEENYHDIHNNTCNNC